MILFFVEVSTRVQYAYNTRYAFVIAYLAEPHGSADASRCRSFSDVANRATNYRALLRKLTYKASDKDIAWIFATLFLLSVKYCLLIYLHFGGPASIPPVIQYESRGIALTFDMSSHVLLKHLCAKMATWKQNFQIDPWPLETFRHYCTFVVSATVCVAVYVAVCVAVCGTSWDVSTLMYIRTWKIWWLYNMVGGACQNG